MFSGKSSNEIRRYLHHHKKEIEALTQALCGFATVNPPGENFEACARFLQKTANDLGLRSRMVNVPRAYIREHLPPECWPYPRYNVIARWNVGAEKTLHFNSHFDVVPATEDWRTPPFAPVVERGRLYGRGTCDMKGCLAASLFAVAALKECGRIPPCNLEFSFTAHA